MPMSDKRVIIVPHTHWDREWYLPFQRFRFMLVELVDQLLDILKQQDYCFMLDGQTVILEDYFEIRPERKEELLREIRAGRVAVGPWYILPDEWLVGGESLIRSLEYSHTLASRFNVPLMDVAYLPDQFGHTSTMPQLLGDLTSLRAAVLWRGVPPEIMTVPFTWKSHPDATVSVLGIYMPGGYGNASRFPEKYDEFVEMVNDRIEDLEQFSPLPVYLLMNGSDHLFPQPFVQGFAERLCQGGLNVSLGIVNDYVSALESEIKKAGYRPPVYAGEFRSPARAPLLQDTYSARIWIKLWNQKVEDILCLKAEPISTYLWLYMDEQYPSVFLETAWKWMLRNHPHDSICGCSVDTTHEEMKARFSWAESIAEGLIDAAVKKMRSSMEPSEETSILVFNPSCVSAVPLYIKFMLPREMIVKGVQDTEGNLYEVQRLESRDDVYLDMTVGMRIAKMGMKLITGRKLMSFYINDVAFFDGEEKGLLELRMMADDHPIGEFDIEDFKRRAQEIFESKKYKRIHIVASKPTQVQYAACIPLPALAFSRITPVSDVIPSSIDDEFLADGNRVINRFYEVRFNKDGTLDVLNRESGHLYSRLHVFEDYGDCGDEYTFSRVGPEKVRVKRVKRSLINQGPVMVEIKQETMLEVFKELDESRSKRAGKAEIEVTSVFRFYRDLPKIDITTRLTNTAKDHRLRVCFDLPFKSEITKTATHFGYIERQGDPERIPETAELERTRSSYPEKPSGIQPQKRFIRVDDANGKDGVTIYNKGMPEVELVAGQRIAITLVRSIGWLSRSDFPERPIHAGPDFETPGAQELGVEFEYHYGFVIHSKNTPICTSADYADTIAESVLSVSFHNAEFPVHLTRPIIRIDNRAVRVSSLRVRDDSILVTMYNLSTQDQFTTIKLAPKITNVERVRIDGSILSKHEISDNSIQVDFAPRQIIMMRLKMK